MPSVTQFTGYLMLNTAAITAYTSTRIFHGMIPETQITLPAINYMVVDKMRQAATNVVRAHMQINVRDTNPERVWTIAGLVKDTFDNYQGTAAGFDAQCGYYDNSRMLTEPNNVYVVPLDIYITYKE